MICVFGDARFVVMKRTRAARGKRKPRSHWAMKIGALAEHASAIPLVSNLDSGCVTANSTSSLMTGLLLLQLSWTSCWISTLQSPF